MRCSRKTEIYGEKRWEEEPERRRNRWRKGCAKKIRGGKKKREGWTKKAEAGGEIGAPWHRRLQTLSIIFGDFLNKGVGRTGWLRTPGWFNTDLESEPADQWPRRGKGDGDTFFLLLPSLWGNSFSLFSKGCIQARLWWMQHNQDKSCKNHRLPLAPPNPLIRIKKKKKSFNHFRALKHWLKSNDKNSPYIEPKS